MENSKLRDSITDLSQSFRKMVFVWDKAMEFFEDNSDFIVAEFKEDVDEIKSELQNFVNNTEETISSDVDDIKSLSPEDLANKIKAAFSSLQNDMQSSSDDLSSKISDSESSLSSDSDDMKSNVRREEAKVYYNEAVANMKRAAEALHQSIQYRLDGMKPE